MKRTQEREQAFILIFEKCFRDDDLECIIEDAIAGGEFEENEYSIRCFDGVYSNLEDIDAKISENLSGWTIDRISKVALCIMRLAVYEMLYVDEVPVSVAINEAVELCKKYATADDSSYLNGVLGTISRL